MAEDRRACTMAIRVVRHAALGVLVIWVLSLGMAAPVAHYQSIVESGDNNTYCWDAWPDPHKKVYVVCTFVLGYLLPLALISVCYAKVSAACTRAFLEFGVLGRSVKGDIRMVLECCVFWFMWML